MTFVRGVELIYLVPEHGGPAVSVEKVVADAGRGLRGDRHYGEENSCDLTLIESEALARLAAEYGLELTGGDSRRNLITSGIDLAELVGRRFRVGEVICAGEERCEPCSHLASLTDPAVLQGLLHTGLRASIMESGVIRAGDAVELLP